MFNSVYNRVMAAAIVMATAGLRRSLPVGAPTRPHEPSLPKARALPRAERNAPRKRRHSSGLRKPNGPQECARRVRQIRAGYLTVSNGLVLPQRS